MTTSERRRRYQEAHPERIKAAQKKYRDSHHRDRTAYEKSHANELRTYRREYARKHPGLHLRRYNITEEDYDALLSQQGGVCAICGRPPEKRLSVDHNHVTDAVRGLLCMPCNRAIGLLGDSVEGLTRAIDYLITHG